VEDYGTRIRRYIPQETQCTLVVVEETDTGGREIDIEQVLNKLAAGAGLLSGERV